MDMVAVSRQELARLAEVIHHAYHVEHREGHVVGNGYRYTVPGVHGTPGHETCSMPSCAWVQGVLRQHQQVFTTGKCLDPLCSLTLPHKH